MRSTRAIKRAIGFFIFVFNNGINGYLFIMIFSIASVGLAKIILKACKKPDFSYNNFLIFCTIGVILSIILKIIKFNLSIKFLEILVCLITNIIIFKYIKKFLKSKREKNNIDE